MNLVLSVTVFLSLIFIVATETYALKELLLQWDATLTCKIDKRYCFLIKFKAWTYSPILNKKISTHPHICTEKPKTGVSRQLYQYFDGIFNLIDSQKIVSNSVSIVHNCTSDDTFAKIKMDLPSIPLIQSVDNPYADLRPKIMVKEFEVDLTDSGFNCNCPESNECNWAPHKFEKRYNFYDNTDALKDVQHFLNSSSTNVSVS